MEAPKIVKDEMARTYTLFDQNGDAVVEIPESHTVGVGFRQAFAPYIEEMKRKANASNPKKAG